MTPKLIYIAGPYRAKTIHGVYQNVALARSAAEGLVIHGFYPLVPHLNTAFMDGLNSDEFFLAGSLEMMLTADGVLMLPGWEKSEGAKAEYAAAMAEGIPVYLSVADVVAGKAVNAH